MRIFLLTCISVLLAAGESVGWRGDGNGCWPAAAPVADWTAEGVVRWSVDLPSWSNCTPALTADAILLTAEKTGLFCLDRATGETRWKAKVDYASILSEEDAAALAAEVELAKACADQAKVIADQVKNFGNTIYEEGELTKRLDAIDKASAELREKWKAMPLAAKYRMPRAHGGTGYSTPTPACDGTTVVAVFGNGIAAAFDLAGQRKWAKLVQRPSMGHGHAASPLIVGDAAIITINDVTALDLATGEERWACKAKARWGTPVLAAIGERQVLITADGAAIDVADGKVALTGLFKGLTYNSPVVVDGVVYVADNDTARAIKLPAELGEGAKGEQLWTAKIKKDRYYASPLVYRGVLYAVTKGGELSAVKTADGAVLFSKKLDLGRGTVYGSPAAAGDHVFIGNDGGGFVVLKAGEAEEVAAQGKLEGFRGSPVFAGGDCFLRGMKKCYRIGKAE